MLSFILLGRDSGKFSRLLPQVSSFGSSAPLRPLRLASSSIPYGPLCPWDTVACPLPYRLLCIDPVVMVLVHSLPYRTLFLWRWLDSSRRLLPLAAVCSGGSSTHRRSISVLAEAAFRGLDAYVGQFPVSSGTFP